MARALKIGSSTKATKKAANYNVIIKAKTIKGNSNT